MDAIAQNCQAIKRMLRFDLLDPVFQPVFSVPDGAIFGFEGLIRGPRQTEFESPGQLFAVAEDCGMRTELEQAAARAIFRAFSRLRLPGFLMVNYSAAALVDVCQDPARALGALQNEGIAPQNVIIELTEHNRIYDVTRLAALLQPLSRAGISLALDDFGSGHSNLQLWMELRPRLVKLDRAFSNGLSTNGDKFEIVRLLKGLSESFGSQLVAEGIEAASDLAVVRDMGIPLVQGFLLGRPAAVPAQQASAEAVSVINSRKISALPEPKRGVSRFRLAGELARPIPPLSPSVTNEQLRRFFKDHPEWHGVAVVDDGCPVGVVDRKSFMDRYAQPFQRELFGRRPLSSFMNETPLVVERRTPVESLATVLTGDDQRYLSDGFIVVDNGRYVGLATGEDLVRAVTELRVEAARYANPLTFLPGNIPISQHLDRLLAASVPFVACYADLDNFKPFNDQYGYWRGDEVIRLAAAVIQANADPTLDFVGHVGGDDFLVVFQSADWELRASRIIDDFNARMRPFFARKEIAEQGFWGEDRKGVRTFFPLTSMAIGAVVVVPGSLDHHEDVASAAAAAKRKAKKSVPQMHIDAAELLHAPAEV
jgi:diguanylate cyclase (GGDEF)-like protein